MSNDFPNFLVLNPYSKGFFVFTKPAGGEFQYLLVTNCVQEIVHAVCQLPRPRLAVHIDQPDNSFLGQLILHEIDLCTIPMPWLSHIPLYQFTARAQFAVHLVQIYLSDPIRRFGAKKPSP